MSIATNVPAAERKVSEGKGYTFTQTDDELTMTVPIDDAIKAKDVLYELTPTTLTVGVKGKDAIIKGELLFSTKPDDSFWELDTSEQGRCIKIVLKKGKEFTHWESIMKDESTKSESAEDTAVKALVREWPQLQGLDDASLKIMAELRPEITKLDEQTSRKELLRIIEKINVVLKKVENNEEASKFLLEWIMRVQTFFVGRGADGAV